jgi:hypothetical protein
MHVAEQHRCVAHDPTYAHVEHVRLRSRRDGSRRNVGNVKRAVQVDLGSTHLAPNKPAVHVKHSRSRFSALSLRSSTAFDGRGVLLFRATAGALRSVDVMLSDDTGSR